MKGQIRTLKLADITVDPALQSRANGLNPEAVDEYAEDLATEATREKFPPLVVYFDCETKTHWLSEGFHRHAAALKAGLKSFPCEVREGDKRAALVNSCGSNRPHGLRRTNADKRCAIAKLLAEFPEFSDRWIANAAGVDHKTVAAIRTAREEAERSKGDTGEFPQCNGLNDVLGSGSPSLFDDAEPPNRERAADVLPEQNRDPEPDTEPAPQPQKPKPQPASLKNRPPSREPDALALCGNAARSMLARKDDEQVNSFLFTAGEMMFKTQHVWSLLERFVELVEKRGGPLK